MSRRNLERRLAALEKARQAPANRSPAWMRFHVVRQSQNPYDTLNNRDLVTVIVDAFGRLPDPQADCDRLSDPELSGILDAWKASPADVAGWSEEQCREALGMAL